MNSLYKVIIAGGRDFDNFNMLEDSFFSLYADNIPIEIVSGMAKGADELGNKLAVVNHLPLKMFPANWELFGKSAGYLRNIQMAEYADALLAFWDGESRGTKMMIHEAKRRHMRVDVVRYSMRSMKDGS